jgi:cation diffusion facilitator family transporter
VLLDVGHPYRLVMADPHDHAHADERKNGHTHGRVDPSILRSHDGVKTVAVSLGVLAATAVAQLGVFLLSGSVALLADLIHNAGDALTALPLGAAFILRSERAERWAGLAVVLAIFVSAVIAGVESIERLIHPVQLNYLVPLAIAGLVGFVGNEIAARIRLQAGRRLDSPALLADGAHARTDGYVSLGVVATAAVVAIGLPRADPIIGLLITAVILHVTWQAWRTVHGSNRHDEHAP